MYVGLAGIEWDGGQVDLGHGVLLRKTYAHLMAPFMVAFFPAPEGKPHPAPWRAARGGFAFDVTLELEISANVWQSPEERMQVAQTVVDLMRFGVSPKISMPIVSNVAFASAADLPDRTSVFIPVEIEPRWFSLASDRDGPMLPNELAWVTDHWKAALELKRQHAEFRNAVDALSRGQFVRNQSLTLVSLWAALESMFSPSTTELRFRVAVLIASFLEPPGAKRRALHKRVMDLYDHRSAAAHGKPKNDADGLLQTFELLRCVVLKIIQNGRVPSREDLESSLFGEGEGGGDVSV